MPTPGLSLLGFLDQQPAMDHLLNACVPSNPDPAAVIAEWNAARGLLGAPIPNAGNPDIQPAPATHQAYVQSVLAHPVFTNEWIGAAIHLVEIDPILAYQTTVDANRTNHHTGTMSGAPTMDELLQCCLPLNPQSEEFKVTPGINSMVLRARSLNVRQFQGFWQANAMGIAFGVSIPFVHVVRHGGQCFLFNGYHRAVSVRKTGATHMPCVLRDVADHGAVGLNPPEFFSMARLRQPDPPTLGHFTQGRAHNVQLRLHSRILHISWGEHAVPEE